MINRNTIQASVTNQTLQLYNLPPIASGSKGVLSIQFTFTGWEEYNGKTAVFYKDKDHVYHVPLTVEPGASDRPFGFVPAEVLADEGTFSLGVFAFGADGTIQTTEAVDVVVKQGAITSATAVSDPTPNIYEQILTQYSSFERRFNTVIALNATSGGLNSFEVTEDEFFVALTSNGVHCYADMSVSGLGLTGYGSRETDWHRVPLAFAPMDSVTLSGGDDNLRVMMVPGETLYDDGVRLVKFGFGNKVADYTNYSSYYSAYYPPMGVVVAEVADMRVGANGETYTTAGDAIRSVETQTTDNEMRVRGLESAFDIYTNLLNPDELVPGVHLSGTVEEDWGDGYPIASTGYISAEPGDVFTYQRTEIASGTRGPGPAHYWFYDADQYALTEAVQTTSGAVTTPEGAAYVRFCLRDYNTTEDWAIVRGSAVVPYTEYNPVQYVLREESLPDGAVLYTEQTLTEEQKAQARANIGAGTGGGADITVDDALSDTSENPVQNKVISKRLLEIATGVDGTFVKKSELDAELSAESVNPVQNKVVKASIDTVNNQVTDHEQRITTLEQSGGGSAESAVLYTPQTLTEAEKKQARYNIGVTESGAVDEGLTEKMDMLVAEVKSKNLLNPNDPDFLVGYKLGTDGIPAVGASYVTTGFIPVTAGQTICFSYLGNALSARVAEYDEDKNTVSVASANTTVYTVPDGVAYIRTHYQKVYNNAVQFELDKITAYEPYFEPYLKLVDEETRPTNAMPKEVLQGILAYQGKLATGTGFSTPLIAIPDGAEKIYFGGNNLFAWTRVQYFDAEQVFITGSAATVNYGASRNYDLLAGAKYIQLAATVEWVDEYADTTISFGRDEAGMAECGYESIPNYFAAQDAAKVWGNLAYPSALIKSVAHRCLPGVGVPECSLPGMKAAKRNGFDYVEADIQATSDRVLVMLHDNIINEQARNPDGTEIAETVRLSDITYEQALQYDYGISAGEEYAGLGLLTFEQFIGYCKNLGLRAYIELKTDAGDLAPTEAEVQSLVATAKAYGMAEYCTWISTSLNYLGYVAAADPTARLGNVVTSITESGINSLLALKTNTNEVFMDSSVFDSASVALCKAAGVPMEVWTVNGDDNVVALDPYISGVTSDYTHAGFARYKAAMQ